MGTPEPLFCDQCGNETHDDQSELWGFGSDLSRVCHECAPPDEWPLDEE